MKTTEIIVTCPHCQQAGFTARGLRNHWCQKLGKNQIHKQDWWIAVDKARLAAGLPEMVYGYDVTFSLHDGTEKKVHGCGSKSQMLMKARLTSFYSKVLKVEELTYKKYCSAYGVPGSKM
jgi:hypothetical protein